MKKLAYHVQIKISVGILLLCFVLAHITKQGVFTNVGWIISCNVGLEGPQVFETWQLHRWYTRYCNRLDYKI